MDANERQRRVAQEASEWWLTLQDNPTRSQREDYVDWLRESSLHVAEMLRVAQVHGALEQFQRWSTLSPGEARDDNVIRLSETGRHKGPKSPQFRTRARRPVAWAAAATVLIVAAIATLFQIHRNEWTISTERGDRREVALTDGSVVQVDPDTRLRIKYEADARRVILDKGRALFRVAKNKDKPFLVEANATTVRAVGTAFAVEKTGDESLVVTVSEGTVAVFPSPPDGRVPGSGIAPLNSNRPIKEAEIRAPQATVVAANAAVWLDANQQVSVQQDRSETVRAVDSSRELAWAQGRLIFENSTVADAVSQFNRYNRIQIIVNDRALAHRLISGTFDAADPDSFAAFIQSVTHAHVSHNESGTITFDGAN